MVTHTPHRLLDKLEVCQLLNIKASMFWVLIKSGELKSCKVRKLRRVPIEAIDEYIQSRLAAEGRNDDDANA